MCFKYGKNFDWYCKLANLLCSSNKLAGFFIFAMADALSLSMERQVVVVSNEYPKIFSFELVRVVVIHFEPFLTSK